MGCGWVCGGVCGWGVLGCWGGGGGPGCNLIRSDPSARSLCPHHSALTTLPHCCTPPTAHTALLHMPQLVKDADLRVLTIAPHVGAYARQIMEEQGLQVGGWERVAGRVGGRG